MDQKLIISNGSVHAASPSWKSAELNQMPSNAALKLKSAQSMTKNRNWLLNRRSALLRLKNGALKKWPKRSGQSRSAYSKNRIN